MIGSLWEFGLQDLLAIVRGVKLLDCFKRKVHWSKAFKNAGFCGLLLDYGVDFLVEIGLAQHS